MNHILNKVLLATVVTFSTVVPSFATQADLDAELNNYITLFNGDNYQQQRRAMDTLSWSGFSDPVLFGIIEQKLLDMKSAKGKAALDQAAWYAKALAYSGRDEYRASLQDVADNARKKKLRKHAAEALTRLDDHKVWNPVFAKGLVAAPAGRLEETRVSNMLAADMPELVRMGAKRVYYAHTADTQLLEQASQRLALEYPKVDQANDTKVDAMAWLIKTMAESGQAKYKPLLEEIAAQSKVKKIQKYAEKYAEYLE